MTEGNKGKRSLKKRISGAGCSLLDYLYTDISFQDPRLEPFWSKEPGDGGMSPGKLVFAADLARFAGVSEEILQDSLSGGIEADKVNLGGPAIVPLVHCSQILTDWECSFYGFSSGSEDFAPLDAIVKKLPVNYVRLPSPGALPTTVVLSDPGHHCGAGERTFVNRLGAADLVDPDALPDELFEGDIVLWGGTGLVPPLHDNLGELSRRVKDSGGINVVGTVYDFRNEAKSPVDPWPLGSREDPAYRWIDLLICDQEEALRLSGRETLEEALTFFRDSGLYSLVITRGKEETLVYSEGSTLFGDCPLTAMPVSSYVDSDLAVHPERRGDTTGCGDNFMGGVLTSLARQLENRDRLDLKTAAVEGICAGGLALYSKGGCFVESRPGEKEALMKPIRTDYFSRILPAMDGEAVMEGGV
ncbi:MAG: PfkB family carbohydrate kinase [Spirochaetales bacterium]|nr:PfkB family carbohydrate kinase [Spirochaetales bacterium]